jgi:hypothetical protein
LCNADLPESSHVKFRRNNCHRCWDVGQRSYNDNHCPTIEARKQVGNYELSTAREVVFDAYCICRKVNRKSQQDKNTRPDEYVSEYESV